MDSRTLQKWSIEEKIWGSKFEMERFPREKFWREVKEWTIYVAGVYYPYKITIEPEKK